MARGNKWHLRLRGDAGVGVRGRVIETSNGYFHSKNLLWSRSYNRRQRLRRSILCGNLYSLWKLPNQR